MKQITLVWVLVAGVAAVAWADTFHWVDDKGTVHFTDDPDRIPAKYHKAVAERPAPALSPPSAGSSKPVSLSQSQVRQPQKESGMVFSGGQNEQEWRSRFSAVRTEIKTLQEGLPQKREALDQLRRKRIIYQRTQDRTAYNDLNEKIERDEARIVELQAELSALEIEASRAGVPIEWRR